MKTVSLLQAKGMQAPNTLTTWLGTFTATMDFYFHVASVFLTRKLPSPRLLYWLEVDAAGPISVQHLADGRMIIAVGDRVDATMLRSVFAAEFDFSVVSTSGSPEKVRGFIKNARQPHA
jgi:hypothetical protein